MSRGYTFRHAQTAGDLSFAVQFNDETLWHFALNIVLIAIILFFKIKNLPRNKYYYCSGQFSFAENDKTIKYSLKYINIVEISGKGLIQVTTRRCQNCN